MGRLTAFRHDVGKFGFPGTSVSLRTCVDEIAALSSDVDTATRHVIADEVVAAATGVVLSRPSSLRDCLDALRVPWPSAWFEWREGARLEARMSLGIVDENGEARPLRFGFHVGADLGGRKGLVRFAWSHAGPPGVPPELPSVCPLALNFDLDRRPGDAVPFGRRINVGGLDPRWESNSIEVAAVLDLNERFWVTPTEDGIRTVTAIAANGDMTVEALLDSALGDLAGEANAFIAMMMMMTARGAVQGERIERAKLNKARARKGESLLRDHVEVRLRLSSVERRAEAVARAVGGTAARRMHAVKGHFVNRRGVIYWRRAHTRGLGGPAAAKRTVMVTL